MGRLENMRRQTEYVLLSLESGSLPQVSHASAERLDDALLD